MIELLMKIGQKVDESLIALKDRQTSPCNLGLPIGAWKRAVRYVGRYPVGQRQHHPGIQISPVRPISHRANTYNSEILERPGLFNVLQCLVQILQFLVDDALRLLGALDSLCLESLNGLHLPLNIVCGWLESLELLLDIVDDGLVLEDSAVVSEIDGGGLLLELLNLSAGVVVALLECNEGVGCAAFETKLGTEFGPVQF